MRSKAEELVEKEFEKLLEELRRTADEGLEEVKSRVKEALARAAGSRRR